MFFRFPPDARWNPERSVVEFGIGIGEYEGVVRVSRRVFQILLPDAATSERCQGRGRSTRQSFVRCWSRYQPNKPCPNIWVFGLSAHSIRPRAGFR